jgi:beta-lactamase superfamily II metal-dependent hydrolase
MEPYTLSPNISAKDSLNSPETFYIDICRIGDADSFLLRKDRDFMLVDTGRYDDAEDITALLKKRGTARLKALVITHYDGDHIGAYLAVIDYMNTLKTALNPNTIEHIYARRYSKEQLSILPEDRYRNYVKFINGILRYLNRSAEEFELNALPAYETTEAKADELYGNGEGLWIFPSHANPCSDFTLDDMVYIQWLNREASYLTAGASARVLAGNVNNDSLIFKAVSYGKSALFLADLGYSGLNDLILYRSFYLKSDILKIAHHGHKYSSPSYLIDEINPVISLVTTTLDAIPDNNSFYNRLEELTASNINFGSLIFSGKVYGSYSTIAIRETTPQIYTENTSIIGV